MAKPRLFIGSSVKALDYARVMQVELDHDALVKVWPQDVFKASSYPLPDLVSELKRSNLAAFIFFPEDPLEIREDKSLSVRDNVIFELGMAIGLIGPDRSFIVMPRGQKFHIPTDLTGVNTLDFEVPEDHEDLQSALGPACTTIRERLQSKNPASTASASKTPGGGPAYDRDQAYQEAVARAKPLFHIARYVRNERIGPDGDVLGSEHFVNVEAISGKVSESPGFFSSRAGRATDPQYFDISDPKQSIRWEWLDNDLQAERQNGRTLYDPPLESGHNVSYRRERRLFNAISFTQAERLQATGGQDRDERVHVTFQHLTQEFQALLTFPSRRFPSEFRVAVSDAATDAYDAKETDYAVRRLQRMPETLTVMLVLQRPFPGYKYTIRWDLPEEAAPLFTPAQAGFIEEMSLRLLALRSVQHAHLEQVLGALRSARMKIEARLQSPETQLETVLYIYDRQRGGLACVATLDAPKVETNWAKHLFKPGRGIAGYAFRQRKPAGYIRPLNGSEDRYETVAGETPEERPHTIVCIPLFLPPDQERSLAVLSFAARSQDSPLRAVAEDEAAMSSVGRDLAEWYAKDLAQALGVVPTNTFWAS